MRLAISYLEYDLRQEAKRLLKARWNAVARHWCAPDTYLRSVYVLSPTLAARVVEPLPLPMRPIPKLAPNEAEYLYPFQRDGVKWLEERGSGLWALDMGLGKTVMAVAYVAHLLRHDAISRAIIFCPAAIRHQWQEEFKQREGIDALIVDASTKERRRALYSTDAPVFIIHYELLLRDAEYIAPLLPNAFVVLDEVTRVRNHKSKTHRTLVNLLNSPVAGVVGLTGSPVENSPLDLVNIMTVILPGVITRRQFYSDHCVFESVYLGRKIGYREIAVGFKDLDKLRQRLSPHIFVRTKKDVAPYLPPLTERCIRIAPDSVQQYLEKAILRIAARMARVEGLGKGLLALTALRLVWDDVRLIPLGASKAGNIAFNRLLLEGISVPMQYVSPKLKELATLIDEVGMEQRVVIFTQFERMLQFIEEALREHGRPLFFCRGGQAEENIRQQQAFAESANGILVTTDVLSYGINLDCADILIHFDIPWNPAKMEQRSQRIHRLTSQNPK